jgi:anti-sigma regulatory factor (Ser/Thr protein kinase)
VTTSAEADCEPFLHPALFYHSVQEYVDCLVPFITDALEAQSAVLVAVPAPKLSTLRDALGDTAGDVTMADMAEAGRNPGRILGGVLSRFADDHPGRPVRMIGEPIWPSRSEVEYPACVQHEALINNAFAGRDVTVLCPYDAAELQRDALADACATHPVLWPAGRPESASVDYAPQSIWAHYNEPLPAVATAATYSVRHVADLQAARSFVSTYGQWFGLSAEGIADLRLITSELATRSLQHTDGACRLAFWRHDDHFVCEARDRGHLDDPLIGRRPYERDSQRGQGLFVVNEVADLVRSYTTEGETTIRAYVRLNRAA